MTTVDLVVFGFLLAGSLVQLRWSETRLTSYADRMIALAAFLAIGVRVAGLALLAGAVATLAFALSSRIFGPYEARARAKTAAASAVDTIAAVLAAHLVVRAFGESYPLRTEPFASFAVQLRLWLPTYAYLFATLAVDGALVRFVLRAPDDPRLARLEPLRSSLFTVGVVSVPLAFAARVVYDPRALFPFGFTLAWVFLVNLAFARLLARRRRIGALLDELSTKERLAAVGEVSARVVHHTRHQLALLGITVHRIEKRICALPEDDRRVVREELEKLGDVQRELAGMLTNVLRPAGSGSVPPPPSSYADLVAGVAKRLDGLAVSRGVRLTLGDLAPAARASPSHPDNVSDAIFNVVENALVAARSEVTIAAERRGDTLVVAVRDDGEGMPSEVMAHAKNGVVTTKADGTGMGLVLARAAVEGERGALDIKNRGAGGCEVELAVPMQGGAP